MKKTNPKPLDVAGGVFQRMSLPETCFGFITQPTITNTLIEYVQEKNHKSLD